MPGTGRCSAQTPEPPACQAMQFAPRTVPPATADRVLAESRAWFQGAKRTHKVMGHVIPRDEAAVFFGDSEAKTYRYGNHTMPRLDVVPLMEELRALARAQPGAGAMDLLVINQYQSGMDAVSWHADDEPVIDQTCPIVSFSFNEPGGARTFRVRSKAKAEPGATRKSQTWTLDHGDMIVMPPGMQDTHEHAVLREPRVKGRRVNFTFRTTRRAQEDLPAKRARKQ